MNIDFLLPVDEKLLLSTTSDQSSIKNIGSTVQVYTHKDYFPNLENVKVVILGVKEARRAVNNEACGANLSAVRSNLYQLFSGDWNLQVADIGNIEQGDTVSDTYFALTETISSLIKNDSIPVIIGGSQDLTYAAYRAYDCLEQVVNLVSVDSRLDLGSLQDALHSRSYLSKIIMEEPNNLFNFSNIGYQTYFNSKEEITLLNKLYFDLYRLGEAKNLEIMEPVVRDADIVSVDIGTVRQSEAPANGNASPNGFYGEDVCAIARYAGLSDKVTCFGVYEYNSVLDVREQTAMLIAQMIWYFIEGVNKRAKDYPFISKKKYQKFNVIMEDDEPITFYKSHKSGRWWIEIKLLSNNKYQRHTLIPCTYNDYLQALEQKIPVRWYKALQKLT